MDKNKWGHVGALAHGAEVSATRVGTYFGAMSHGIETYNLSSVSYGGRLRVQIWD
jgi:hypothetical protein